MGGGISIPVVVHIYLVVAFISEMVSCTILINHVIHPLIITVAPIISIRIKLILILILILIVLKLLFIEIVQFVQN